VTNFSFDVQEKVGAGLDNEYIYHGQGIAFHKGGDQLYEKAVRGTFIPTLDCLLMSGSFVGIQRNWLIKVSTTLDVRISI